MSKKLNGLFDNIAKQNADLSKVEVIESPEDKLAILSQYKFTFGADEETENFLKEQTYRVHKTANKMYNELGKIFTETQEKLANNKNGIFSAWYTELGFNRNQVYRLIYRCEFISTQNEKIKLFIENLPISLSYEISSPSCPKELVDKVLSGEITTLKEFIAQKTSFVLENNSEVETAVEIIDYSLIFEKDLKAFSKSSKDLKAKLLEKSKEFSVDKQKLVVEEMEALTKKMEKLINSL